MTKYKSRSGKVFNTLEEALYDNLVSTKFKALSGKLFNTREEAELDNLATVIKKNNGGRGPVENKEVLSFSLIPTKNMVHVIDNFSDKADYIVEGDKVYISDKGKNAWRDISENNVARRNLLHFLSKYDFIGYEDGEKEMYEAAKIKLNKKPTSTKKPAQTTKPVTPLTPRYITTSGTAYAPQLTFDPLVLKVKNPGDLGTAWNMVVDGKIGEAFSFVGRGLQRKFAKRHSNDVVSTLKLPPQALSKNSAYGIVLDSFTGDTIDISNQPYALKGLYVLPENINLNDVKLGVRNRGEFKNITTLGGIITGFAPFTPWKEGLPAGTYIGIDAQGRFKAGDLSEFGPGDRLSKSFSNEIRAFKLDNDGKIATKLSKNNKPLHYPITILPDGKEGSLPALVDKGNTGRYGRILGGRFVVKVGNEIRLLSGSVDNISLLFEAMKKRHKATSGIFYTLDNGSYNTGLRTRSGKITPENLKAYDLQNASGGNFLYLEPLQQFFTSDTIWTPNVRTKTSDSYKSGHPLLNEQRGVVLHHTAFEDPDLTNVTAHLMNPGSEASAHVIIGYDGHRRILAKPSLVTFHAGASAWNGRTNVNDFMVGIEFLGDTNHKDLTDALILSAIEYLKPIIRKNNIRLEDIVTHLLVRDLYNDYAKKLGVATAASKPDISLNSYTKMINALKAQLYFRK